MSEYTEARKARAAYGCTCGRLFTTKSGRTRHMLKCDAVPEDTKDALRSWR